MRQNSICRRTLATALSNCALVGVRRAQMTSNVVASHNTRVATASRACFVSAISLTMRARGLRPTSYAEHALRHSMNQKHLSIAVCARACTRAASTRHHSLHTLHARATKAHKTADYNQPRNPSYAETPLTKAFRTAY